MKTIQSLKNTLALNLVNFNGWNTKKKLIVFESDDWGSTRMPSSEIFNSLKAKGLQVHKSFYNTYDALEQREDIDMLLNVLAAHKDKNNNTAIFTPNMVVANPDFEKIKASGFTRYEYEPFDVTYSKNGDNILPIWLKAISECLVEPQFHAREHVNAELWMKSLQAKDKDSMIAFEHGFFGHKVNTAQYRTRTFLAAYDARTQAEIDQVNRITRDGLHIFEEKFGYRATSFIACNYVWPAALEGFLKEQGINYIQTRRVQSEPVKDGGYARIIHHTGQKNAYGQIYTVRNCYFEPSSDKDKDWVNDCLREIKNAFFYGRPAVISCHRLNFIGSLDISNRDKGLRLLDTLLKRIILTWPDVEFLSSGQLGNAISKSQQ